MSHPSPVRRSVHAALSALLLSFATPAGADPATAPSGLLCELLANPERAVVTDPQPEFGWCPPATVADDRQTAYHILVSEDPAALRGDRGAMWDSGKVASPHSLSVSYAGAPLKPGATYHWKVRTWNRLDQPSGWSAPQAFRTGAKLGDYSTPRYDLGTVALPPVRVVRRPDGVVFVDFGRAAFGWLTLDVEAPADGATVAVHLGEKLAGPDTVDRKPGGTIRYARADIALKKGRHSYRTDPPADKRNTSGQAILLPPRFGTVVPFRYAELENVPGAVDGANVRQVMVLYPFDDSAAAFKCSDPVLNDVWELCRYSIKATTFCGVYVDGDRERIPYEADAYINQLCHYGTDREFALARHSHEYLLEHPTWPTEWKHHSILMAWADYLHTGDKDSMAQHYDLLKTKTLEERAGPDGLILSNEKQVKRDDIVDWPAGERDGFVHRPVNTVVNAFYIRSLELMRDIAAALGRDADAKGYGAKAARARAAFNATLFDAARGIYVDGAGTDHASLHANMLPLAFDLAPPERRKTVTAFVKSRGMACSVYGAQYLLEALYANGEEAHALDLMTTGGERGWVNMMRAGSTITLEAWDIKFKPNLDWNHAWGAAPANIIPRFVVGLQPVEPGYARATLRPRPGRLDSFDATVPTIRGPVKAAFRKEAGGALDLRVSVPVGMTLRVGLPAGPRADAALEVDGRPVRGALEDGAVFVDGIGSGPHRIRRP